MHLLGSFYSGVSVVSNYAWAKLIQEVNPWNPVCPQQSHSVRAFISGMHFMLVLHSISEKHILEEILLQTLWGISRKSSMVQFFKRITNIVGFPRMACRTNHQPPRCELSLQEKKVLSPNNWYTNKMCRTQWKMTKDNKRVKEPKCLDNQPFN